MRRYDDIYVVKAKSGWDIVSSSEACSFADELLSRTHFEVGDNIRIRNEDNMESGAIQIARTHDAGLDSGNSDWVRLGKSARETFWYDNSDTFPATVVEQVTKVGLQSGEDAKSQQPAVYEEFKIRPRDRICSYSHHGGDINLQTSRQGTRAASRIRDAAWWEAEGYAERSAFDAWHITATKLNGNAWRGLHRLEQFSPWEMAISWNGYTEAYRDNDPFLVGGRVDLSFREFVADIMRDADHSFDVRVVGPGKDDGEFSDLSGSEEDNFTNELCANGGLQIEQPYQFRDQHAMLAAEVVGKATHDWFIGDS